MLPRLNYTEDEIKRSRGMEAEIFEYTESMFNRFVSGEVPLNQYQTYLDELNKKGLKDILQIKQNALNRYYSQR